MSITIEKIAEKTLPTIALRGIVLFPHVITSFEIARKASIKALKQAQESGTELFLAAKDWARKKGARKLYISAHSAVESQAFYQKMGCVQAEVPSQEHVAKEPYDCQLECRLE